MKVLVVDDAESKVSAISEILAEYHLELDVAWSINSAKKLIREKNYDLFILDMNLPTFDINGDGGSGRIVASGGLELLRYASRYSQNWLSILFTQYDSIEIDGKIKTILDISNEIYELYKEKFVGYVRYTTDSEDWRSKIVSILKEVLNENIDSR